MGQNRDPDQEPRKTSPRRTQRAQRTQGKQDLGRARTETHTRNLESHHRRERRGRRGRGAETGQNRDPDQEPRKTSPQSAQRTQGKQGKQDLGRARTETHTRNLEGRHRGERRGRGERRSILDHGSTRPERVPRCGCGPPGRDSGPHSGRLGSLSASAISAVRSACCPQRCAPGRGARARPWTGASLISFPQQDTRNGGGSSRVEREDGTSTT